MDPAATASAARKDAAHIDRDWAIQRRLIDGVKVREVRNVVTANGITTELYRPDWDFVDGTVQQAIHVALRGHAISAWHQHKHRWDYVFAVGGHLRIVLHDPREGSPTRDQIDVFRQWDHRWAVDSVATALAVYWGDELWRRSTEAAAQAGLSVYTYIETKASPRERLDALKAASDKLTADFGTWKTAWGDINRFQRLTGDLTQPFNDSSPSIPVGFTSGRWGSLASFGARTYPGTKKMYGTSGNSFVAVVEFGDTVRARAVTAGGQSGHPSSPHFNDQATRYATGNLRDVYFYRPQLEGHIQRQYRPGE